jgi:hypothetical protein
MRRPLSTRISFLEATACLAGTLAACLSSETVDLGSNYNYEVRLPEAGSPPPPIVESGPDSPVDPTTDAEYGDAADEMAVEPEADAPVPPTGAAICIWNASFEPLAGNAGPLLAAPPLWQACSVNVPTPQICKLAPTDGSSYLGLSIGLAPYLTNPGSVDAMLCTALHAGVTYTLRLDLALDAPEGDASLSGEPPALQVRGSNTACDLRGTLLARFSGATNTCGWRKSLCATITPDQEYWHLILVPEATSSTARVFFQTNLLVDNLTSGGTCPPL